MQTDRPTERHTDRVITYHVVIVIIFIAVDLLLLTRRHRC